MNLIPCNAFEIHEFLTTIDYSKSKEVIEKVETLYGYDGYLPMTRVFQFLGLIESLEGKTILDLGCGAKDSEDKITTSQRLFEPWLPRILHEYEVNAIGVDTKDLSDEPFQGYSVDLFDIDSLSFLGDYSVDIACAFSLFDSPALLGSSTFGLCSEIGPRLFNRLLPQLKRVVKPEGYFVFENTNTSYST